MCTYSPICYKMCVLFYIPDQHIYSHTLLKVCCYTSTNNTQSIKDGWHIYYQHIYILSFVSKCATIESTFIVNVQHTYIFSFDSICAWYNNTFIYAEGNKAINTILLFISCYERKQILAMTACNFHMSYM